MIDLEQWVGKQVRTEDPSIPPCGHPDCDHPECVEPGATFGAQGVVDAVDGEWLHLDWGYSIRTTEHTRITEVQ